MDALSGLLVGPRARGAFILRSVLSPPWSVRVQDQAPLSIVALTRGTAWAIPDDGDAVRLLPGDIAIRRGPAPYTFADDPSTPVQVVIHPGPRRTTPTGEHLSEVIDLGPRTWGTGDPDRAAVMLIGKYQMSGEISHRLLRTLQPLLVLPHDAQPSSPLIGMLTEEITKEEAGQQVVLDRLLDLLLVTTLRAWFARPEAEAPAWYRALADPVIGPTLRLLHNDPAHPWTVAALAARAGVSRAGLARRFTDLVGEPPMAYLTGWRLDTAADLLHEPDTTIAAVARQVGYASASALSTAFKRERGSSPQQYRRSREP
ncbi:AraC family transcriptional regulator [Nonomuraea deserti]|uniref:AraC family transcriptional regulator n=1 Tax=Nonomuraea deserti TaxID=1848322 RepID=A0A4R4UGM7_9ACTN|nr:AraC family transcriptional regulator [Nonomuraea deserti]TDC90610.1 AraC family transcriptional regulator [Nonomuraea deserti]